MRYCCLIALLAFFSRCGEKSVPETDGDSSHQVMTDDQTAKSTNLTRRVIRNEDGTYGYEIFLDEKKMISQPHSPVLSGNDGFKSEDQAGRVADLVIHKIKSGEMPPTIERVELDSLIKLD